MSTIHINSKAEYPSFKGAAQYLVFSKTGRLFEATQTPQIIIRDRYRQQLLQLNRKLKAKQQE